MKIVKRILIVFGVVLILLVAAAIIVPIVFKDDIKASLDKAIAKTVNADVIFDVDNFSLTVFKNFPNVTIQIKELGVFNREPFDNVPLFVMQELDVEVNLKDIIFGDQLRVKGITLIDPQITIKVLKDGAPTTTSPTLLQNRPRKRQTQASLHSVSTIGRSSTAVFPTTTSHYPIY